MKSPIMKIHIHVAKTMPIRAFSRHCWFLFHSQNNTKVDSIGTSLVVQWLRLCASSARDVGLIPGWGTKIPHAMWSGQKN